MSDNNKSNNATTATAAEATPKATAKTRRKTDGGSVLKSAGKRACKRHELPEVWVTADGQCFALESDAKAHAANLNNNKIENVKA